MNFSFFAISLCSVAFVINFLIFQEASNAAPVTLKVDRNGFFILWYSDQKKVS